MENELVVIEEGKALEVFQTEGGLDFILDEAKALVDGFTHDLSTDKGRKATASLGYKVAQFKTKLDGMGKELVSGWKTQAKLVDNNRKHVRDTLDALKVEALQPLTEWKEAEASRVAGHQLEIENLKALVENEEETSTGYAANLATAKLVNMGPCWDEFAGEAAEVKDEVILYLEGALAKALKLEAEQAELERLRVAEEERKEREEKERLEKEQREREEKAAEDARLLAEKQAEEKRQVAEREAKEREERLRIEKEEAEEETRRVERERIATEERAKLEAEAAEKRRLESIEQTKLNEAARIQREVAEKKATQDKLEANKRHTNKIKKQAVASLKALSIPAFDAIRIVKAIADGEIANVSINY